MKKLILKFAFTALTVTAAVFSPLVARAGEPAPSDTARVLRFHFQSDKSVFLRDYKGNAAGLDTIRRIASDPGAISHLRGITVTGASSPDGSSRNEALSRKRAREVGGYIGWKYPGLKAKGIELRSIGEDWEGLESLVNSDPGVPMRDEVLRILRSEASSGEKTIGLRKLDGGRVYDYLQRHILPELRYADVVMAFSVPQTADITGAAPQTTPTPERHKQTGQPQPKPAEPAVTEPVTKSPETVTAVPTAVTGRDGYRFAIKTNLMEWAGIFPDFSGLRSGVNYYGITPNLEAEWFITPRWSLALSGSWTGLKIGSNDLKRRWGYSSVSLEPRVWFGGSRANTGFFAGVYGSAGQYNMFFKGMELANSGDIYSAGLSVGYAAMLTKHLMIEAGVRGGYASAENFLFPTEPYDIRYKVSSGTVDGFRLQLFRVSIGYRFGK